MTKDNIEIQGKSIKEAVEKALKELKVSRDKVKIEVVCEEEKGLFDMEGARPAKVRITLIKSKKSKMKPRLTEHKRA